MSIPRRAFLVRTGTAVAGLCWLGCDAEDPVPESGKGVVPPPPPPKPQALIDALERVRAGNKPGIALRIPKDPEHRHSPGHVLLYVLNQDTPESREVLSEVVLVCLEGPVLDRHLPTAHPEHELVLFNEEGQTETSSPFNYREQWQGLAAALKNLAHGSDGARLKARAEAIRGKTAPAVLAVLDRLGAKGLNLEADKAVLLQEAPRIIALLVQARMDSTAPVQQQALGDVIDAYFRSFEASVAGPKLPYGIEAGPYQGGCGEDPCREHAPRDRGVMVSCGMALVQPNARSFVRYITR